MSANSGAARPHFAPPAQARGDSIRDVKDRPPPTCPRHAAATRAAAGLAAVIGALACAAAAPAGAQGLPAALPAAGLAQALALAQQAAERRAPAGARVHASLGPLDPRLKPAACAEAAAFLPPGVPAWGRTRVGLRCLQGPVRWTLYLPLQVQVQAPALALRAALPAGSVLAEADLQVQWVDWTGQAQAPLTEPATAAGRTLARPAGAGQALREADLQPRRWFAAGDRVKVVAGGSGYAVSAEGQALAEGRDGQRVRVQMLLRATDGSTSPGPVVQGQAVGDRTVALFQ